MSANGDSRRLKRARYHQWMQDRWERRNRAAAAKRLADELRQAIDLRDRERLESVALDAGTHDVIRLAAIEAGISLDTLEEALAQI